LKNGKKVTTAGAWWKERRPEIVEDFEREVLGRIPRTVPAIKWSVTATEEWSAGSHPVVGRQLAGHVDNSSSPSIAVDIQMTLVVPADAKQPVPVMIMFGNGLLPSAAAAAARGRAGPPQAATSDPPATEQLIADGWGYVSLSPTSVQADHGAGLTKGIIGLVNKGERRKPDDWGAL